MLSLKSYEHVRRSVSLITHLVLVSFAVSEYQLSFGVFGLSETNIRNSPAGTKILAIYKIDDTADFEYLG